MKPDKLTAGQLDYSLRNDPNSYNAYEVAGDVCEDLPKHLWECVDKHRPIIDERQFCVVMLIQQDQLLKTVYKRRFYAWPFLPKVRADQSVWLYDKDKDSLDFLWAMPEPEAMAMLAHMPTVDYSLMRMKYWVDHFYAGDFYDRIREDNGIEMFTEAEFLKLHAKELREAATHYGIRRLTDAADAQQVNV